MSTLKVNTVQHNTSGFSNVVQFTDGAGTENGKLCRAWVNFNGNGTIAIRDSFNVASITDNGTGDYTINLTTAMANANYAITGTIGTFGSTGASDLFLGGGRQTNYSDVRATGAARFASTNAAGGSEDGAIVSLVIFGD